MNPVISIFHRFFPECIVKQFTKTQSDLMTFLIGLHIIEYSD